MKNVIKLIGITACISLAATAYGASSSSVPVVACDFVSSSSIGGAKSGSTSVPAKTAVVVLPQRTMHIRAALIERGITAALTSIIEGYVPDVIFDTAEHVQAWLRKKSELLQKLKADNKYPLYPMNLPKDNRFPIAGFKDCLMLSHNKISIIEVGLFTKAPSRGFCRLVYEYDHDNKKISLYDALPLGNLEFPGADTPEGAMKYHNPTEELVLLEGRYTGDQSLELPIETPLLVTKGVYERITFNPFNIEYFAPLPPLYVYVIDHCPLGGTRVAVEEIESEQGTAPSSSSSSSTSHS